MNKPRQGAIFPVQTPLFRADRRLRIALVGLPRSGKSTLFQAVSSTSVKSGELTGTDSAYEACRVQIGLDEASLVDLPSITSLLHLAPDDQVTLKYLLWGDHPPLVAAHEPGKPPAPFAPPEVMIQVIDATTLDRHLELSLELCRLGRPMVIALNMMDQAQNKGMHINCAALSKQLGVPVVPTVALMGHGIPDLFTTAVDAVRRVTLPHTQAVNAHLDTALSPIYQALDHSEITRAFGVPASFLVMQIAERDRYFETELAQHFPHLVAEIAAYRDLAEQSLPRSLADELHADRHFRAASLFESVSRLGGIADRRNWRYWLDELFLHPQWGLLGSLMVFALVLLVVFKAGAWLDGLTAARLIDLFAGWQPLGLGGVIGRAIVDGLIGLVGIVVPYMIPLVLLLVVLEETGIMQRIAFVVDRGFHHIGLHGGVAVPFLLGLGCNVPALSAVASTASGRERVVASLLITFVPCSARSAIILAVGGKYLGGLGVFMIFLMTIIVIAVLGRLLTRRYPESGPGQMLEIPAYALPEWREVLSTTWDRTKDILTIVTPLLVGGSIVLALLAYYKADDNINLLLTPVTAWWLGLPLVLGVPILFGVLRKELSLLMIFQALGTFEIGMYLDWIQITTFLIFLTFYIPCVSTFAVMLKTIGRREALFSISLSVVVALMISGVVRLMLEGSRFLL